MVFDLEQLPYLVSFEKFQIVLNFEIGFFFIGALAETLD